MANSLRNDANAQRLWLEGLGNILLSIQVQLDTISYHGRVLSSNNNIIGHLIHAIIGMISEIDIHCMSFLNGYCTSAINSSFLLSIHKNIATMKQCRCRHIRASLPLEIVWIRHGIIQPLTNDVVYYHTIVATQKEIAGVAFRCQHSMEAELVSPYCCASLHLS